MIKWDNLPPYMQNPQVKEYYDILSKKKGGLVLKRALDIFLSLVLVVVLAIPMIIISLVVKFTSEGPIIFKQIRVTTGGREFKILKFRTMTVKQDKDSSQITLINDQRITGCGRFLRKYRLDELPQLFNVLSGSMSFVGTRPEVPRYVKRYSQEMYATLLMPAGITSPASIEFKDEEAFLDGEDTDEKYVKLVLPKKMKLNLEYIKSFSVLNDIKIMIKTLTGVIAG